MLRNNQNFENINNNTPFLLICTFDIHIYYISLCTGFESFNESIFWNNILSRLYHEYSFYRLNINIIAIVLRTLVIIVVFYLL